ncbi:MAG: DUF305 domain-containing protein [Rhodococcus sp. (in: high G+C Gram-positive bacteria)]
MTGASVGLADADIDFTQRMSAHHQQAITMVEMVAAAAAPNVRAVAEQLRTSQWREIGTLTGWLELAGEAMQPPARPADTQHRGHSAMPDMPGMASNEELTGWGRRSVSNARCCSCS